MSSQISHQDIYGKHFQGRLFYDKKAIKAPALIIVSGSEGRIEKAQNIAQLLSSRGYILPSSCLLWFRGIAKTFGTYSFRVPCGSKGLSTSASIKLDSERIGIYGRSKGAEFV